MCLRCNSGDEMRSIMRAKNRSRIGEMMVFEVLVERVTEESLLTISEIKGFESRDGPEMTTI